MFRIFENYGCIPALGILDFLRTALKPGDGMYGAVDNSSVDRAPNGNLGIQTSTSHGIKKN
jgi:hypothetical protein